MKLKTIIARVALVWILLAQMFYVCLAAHTTIPLSRLEASFAFAPSPSHKAALDNEFERVATYESHRAIGKFTLLLTLDVALISLFWNFGMKRQLVVNGNGEVSGEPLPAS